MIRSMSRKEIGYCIITGITVVSVCAPDIMCISEWTGLNRTFWTRTIIYMVLSCMWPYCVVVILGTVKSHGESLANCTGVLTTTRFIIVFFAPLWIVWPWSVLMCMWMAWVTMRHQSMQMHPKRFNEDALEHISHIVNMCSLEDVSVLNEVRHTPSPTPDLLLY